MQQDGKIAHKQWFICKGFIAGYFNYHHLKHTCLFAGNESFIQSPTGFETHQKARETIFAQTDLHTLFTTYEKLEELILIDPFMLKVYNFIKTINKKREQDRIRSLLIDPPCLKLKNLLDDFPTILTQASHTQIATYLGISLRTFNYALSKYYKS